jgi:hypothetical protein
LGTSQSKTVITEQLSTDVDDNENASVRVIDSARTQLWQYVTPRRGVFRACEEGSEMKARLTIMQYQGATTRRMFEER